LAVRELLAQVWQIANLESQTDIVWRAVLLAAGAEADGARRLQGRSLRTDLAEAADQHVATLRGVAARLHVVGPLGEAWTRHLAGDLLRYEGLDTPEVWQGAEEAWAAVGVPHDRGWALLHRAECHLRQGDRALAQKATTVAHTIAVGLGAKPLVDAATALAHRSRLRLDPTAADGSADRRPRLGALTEREAEVLQLVALGLSNDQIASRLFISPRTASVHVSRILAKLGVSSRSEAAAVAFRHGLVAD
jgi:DNA-binding CsgD family transcriptional regulator